MSVHSAPPTKRGSPLARKKMTAAALLAYPSAGKRIAVLTAYDFPTARTADRAGADVILVGDSLAQTALGLPSTTQLTLSAAIHHTAAAARGTSSALLVADMPFGSYGVNDAVRLIREGCADAVKLEGRPDALKAIVDAGIPAMGHIGLLPQRASATGFRVQAKSAEAARRLLDEAFAMQEAGAFAVVLEAVPWQVAQHVTRLLKIPTIGIGAGMHTSGQVLVYADALGSWEGHTAKFVRRFGALGDAADAGARAYVAAVRDGSFPDNEKEGYAMEEEELTQFEWLMGEEAIGQR